MKRKIRIEIIPEDPGAPLHLCSVCGKEDAWSESWVWYGAYTDLERASFTAPKMCSTPCREIWHDRNRLLVAADELRNKRKRL